MGTVCGTPVARIKDSVLLALGFVLVGICVQGCGPISPTESPSATATTKVPPITITSVSTVTHLQTQTILISGSGFGTQAPFNGDLPCIEISDLTAGWSAGHADPANAPGTGTGASCSMPKSATVDLVTIQVSSWNDTAITITGFTGYYVSPYVLTPGNRVRIQVWNAQTGAGPASYTTTVQAAGP